MIGFDGRSPVRLVCSLLLVVLLLEAPLGVSIARAREIERPTCLPEAVSVRRAAAAGSPSGFLMNGQSPVPERVLEIGSPGDLSAGRIDGIPPAVRPLSWLRLPFGAQAEWGTPEPEGAPFYKKKWFLFGALGLLGGVALVLALGGGDEEVAEERAPLPDFPPPPGS